MAHLRGLKEITELEILITRDPMDPPEIAYFAQIKTLAEEILRASECYKDCVCKCEFRCTETGECGRCGPPKRFLRVKTLPVGITRPITRIITVDRGSCLEEIEVKPQQVSPTE